MGNSRRRAAGVAPPSRRRSRWTAAAVIAAAIAAGAAGVAQQPAHTPTTLAALEAYTSFFHRRPVVVRATPAGDFGDVVLTDGDHRIRALNVAPPVGGEAELLEVEGTYWDVGRLPPDDPRLAGHPIGRWSEDLFAKPWPASGELLLLIADETRRVREPDAVTIQNIALRPADYRDQTVTVTGRFRGRNLYGDLPEAPGTSPYDFVLQSGQAAVWVVGREPKGRGFELDVMARVDTGRWLEVTGVVGGADRLIEISAERIAQVERPDTAPDVPAPAVTGSRAPDPPPEVIFSAPTQDETDVPVDGLVRVQFSRDMEDTSFDGHVDVRYVGAAPDDAPPEFELRYQRRNRVLSLSFAQPLEEYRTMEVELTDAILASDGTGLVPYVIRFSTGGS